jgi:hypothetical protein
VVWGCRVIGRSTSPNAGAMARVRLHVALATSLVLIACINLVFLYFAASSVGAGGSRDGRLLAFMSSGTAVAARPTPSTACTHRLCTPAVRSVHTLCTRIRRSHPAANRGEDAAASVDVIVIHLH